MKICRALIVFLLFVLPLQVFGVVDYKTGNYYQEFIDLQIPFKGSTIQFKRSYNSVSSYQGLFGRGWGSSFEFKVEYVDRAIIISEMGNGRHSIYVPQDENLESSLQKVLNTAQEKNKLRGEAFDRFKERLLLDPQQIAEYSNKTSQPPVGLYKNLNNPFTSLKKTLNGIEFTDGQANLWVLNNQNQIIYLITATGHKFVAQYQGRNLISLYHPELIIQFKQELNGFLEVKAGSYKASYKFVLQDISSSTDQNGITYEYKYENGKLISIKGNDIDEVISYDFRTGSVKSVKKPDEETFYSFSVRTHPTYVTKTEVISKVRGTSVYEYEHRVGKEGPYVYRRSVKQNNQLTETVFDECCGRPISIKNSKGRAQVSYQANGLPLKLVSPLGKVYSWKWDDNNQLLEFISPDEKRTYKYLEQLPINVTSKKWGSVEVKYLKGEVQEAKVTSPNQVSETFKFVIDLTNQTSQMIAPGNKIAHLKRNAYGTWAFDPSKKSDPEAKMQLFMWLQIQADLLKAPQVDEIMRSF